eukprot:s1608_g1.t2
MSPTDAPMDAPTTVPREPAGQETLQIAVPPQGQPVVYGPVARRGDQALAVNPFWSEKVRDEAILRSIRPQELPGSDPSTQRASSSEEDTSGGIPDLRHLLTMVLQQTSQLKQELDELRGQVQSQKDFKGVAPVVEKSELMGQRDVPSLSGSSPERGILALQDGKIEEVEPVSAGDWKTPPESVSAKRSNGVELENSSEPPVEVQPVSGAAGTAETKVQQQMLGQVTQTLTDLVAQLVAASAPTGGVQVLRNVPDGVQGQGLSHGGMQGHQHGAQSEQGPQGSQHPGGADGQPPSGGPGQGPYGGGHGHFGHGPGHGNYGGSSGCGGFGGGFSGKGGDGFGLGGPGISRGTPYPIPHDMMWFQGMNEAIRSVELPPLPGIREGELGGSVVGDWMTLVAPVMKDLSISSCTWWESVTKAAGEAYQRWLLSDPVQRLHVNPVMPPECATTWARLEQRGQSMLLGALPEGLKSEVLASRSTNTVEILYRIYTRYQPGGLGEKALLLRQLVDGKTPNSASEFLEQVRNWKRNLRRAQELNVATPDPTLLIGALDKMSSAIIKTSTQMAFRLNSTRAQLMVDINPTLASVTNYADAVMAEAEGLLHAGAQVNATVKVKALNNEAVDGPSKGDGKDGKGGKGLEKSGRVACKFFGTEDGCKKGQDCTYLHDWSTLDKGGPPRCWTCSSTKHARRDCTVKAINGSGDGKGGDKGQGSGDQHGKGKRGGGKGKPLESTPTLKKTEKASEEVEPPKKEENETKVQPSGATAPAQEVLQEAVSLLKSLRLPAVRSMRISSLEVHSGGRALLDGGATHALRTAANLHEWESGIEVKVELAQGHTTLRQLLLSSSPVQCIVPLGVLAEIGYAIRWEGTMFELLDPAGCVVDSKLEGSCPTVTEELGLELIKEVEKHHLERRARLAVLRGEGNVGGLPSEEVKNLEELRMMFPEVPEHLLVRVLPGQKAAGTYREGDLPWNRRQRKRLRRAHQIVVHLFSGKDEKFWKRELETQTRAVLCVDTELDSRQNLLRDDVMEFLLELADSGNTAAWLGGPPCRTMSRLRYRQPGPPPLRSREGPERFAERFGLKDLEEAMKRRVEDDTVLWLRQYYLYHRAKKASIRKVLYLSEQPEDPERYLDPTTIAKQRYPSYWAFPEWDWMKQENDFIEDMEPHPLRQHLTLEERINKSKGWAAWSSGLKMAIATGIQRELNPWLWKMSLDQWKQHILQDHQPYYRGCRTCLEACGQSRHHRKVVTPDSFTLAIDLAGPFKRGEDQLGFGRYMLVGSYTLPISKEGRALHLGDQETPVQRCHNPGGEGDGTASIGGAPAWLCHHPGGEGDGSEVAEGVREADSSQAPDYVEGGIFNDEPSDPPEEEKTQEGPDPLEMEEDPTPESPKDEKKDDADEWKRKIEAEENFKISQLTLVEVIPDRRESSVLSALSRMHARLRYLGLPILRLHSDRAGELRSKAQRKWAEDRKILRTYTDGDSFKSNGRVEAEIGVLKKQIRTLLKDSGEDLKFWPLAARHASERRLRAQLEALGQPTRSMLKFGQTGFATQKSWCEKYSDWRMSRRKVTIMGPDVAMSASMPGYYVRGEDGKFFHTADVAVAEGPPPDMQIEDVEMGALHEHGVRRRITGKTTMLSALKAPMESEESQVPVEEIEQRRIRGLQLLMEELDLQDVAVEDFTEKLNDDDASGSDRFIRSLLADVEGIAGDLEELEKDRQLHEETELEEAAENQEVFLQTRMFSLPEVRAHLQDWIPSMKSELDSLMNETSAIREITKDEAERLRREAESKGILFERIPAKAIFSRKAGTGKRKCRACACGNYMTQRDQTDTYAGGTGATEVRTVLRKAGLEGWEAVALDVKTAFLRAPRDHSREIVVVQPPAIFVLAGLCAPESLWLVEKALYGLTTSPKEWTQFRNQSIKDFNWKADGKSYKATKTNDQDIWKIEEIMESTTATVQHCHSPGGEGDGSVSTVGAPVHRCHHPRAEGDGTASIGGRTVGLFVTYVDDVLAVGSKKVLEGFCARMKEEWEVGEPDWVTINGPPVRFLGMEIELKDRKFRIHQRAYLQNLLEKYPGEKGGTLSNIRPPDEEAQIDPKDVQIAQRQTGELLWVAGRTRPDVCYAVNLMCQYATKRPKGVQAIGKEVRNYLKGTIELALEYGELEDGDFGEENTQRRSRHANLVEVYTDASFASNGLRSMSGVAGFFAGAPVFWITCRQSFTTLSTAESELMSLLEGLTALRCVRSLVEMIQEREVDGRMYSDSTAAISIATGTTGSWRTRHLRIRAQGLHEALEKGEVTLEHQPGRCLVADGLTKQLIGSPLQRFVQALKLMKEKQEVIQMSSLRLEGGDTPSVRRLQDSMSLLVAASAMLLTPVEATEALSSGDEDGGLGVIITIVLIAVLILGDLVTRFGLPKLRSWIFPKEELKVKLLDEAATLPARGTTGSAGLDLCSTRDYQIAPGEHQLIRTGLAMELPRGTYGRLASRSGLATCGIEVSAGVIDRDYRGEIKVLLRNVSNRDFWVRQGDRIAQLIVEKVMEVNIQQVESLSETTRGHQGLGSTGLERIGDGSLDSGGAVRSLRLGTLSGGSSATIERTQSGGSSATRTQRSMGRTELMTAEEVSQLFVPSRGIPSTPRRVTAEELLEKRPVTAPEIPTDDIPVHRCRAPNVSGDGTASTGGNQRSGRQGGGSSATRLSSSMSRSRSLWTQVPMKHSLNMEDRVPEIQPRQVIGCPGLLKWDLATPKHWVSSPGESMESLVERSRMADFWPLENDEVKSVLSDALGAPERDRWVEVQLNSKTILMIRVHSQPRKKVYDFDDSALTSTWTYGRLHLTYATSVSGQHHLASGHRLGNGSPYLDEKWTGFTFFLRAWATRAGDKCKIMQGAQNGRQEWETSVGDKCGRQEWETSVGDKWETSVGDKSGRQVGDKCGRQKWETSVGDKSGRQVKNHAEHPEWETSVGDKWKTSVGNKWETSVGDKWETRVGDKW